MERSTQEIEQGSRWPLYHGTSTLRLERIRAENRLRVSETEPQKVALTTEHSVAELFACQAAMADLQKDSHCDSRPVVIELDGEGLVWLMYGMDFYESPGEDDWQNEIACWGDIVDLDDVLIFARPVDEERWNAFQQSRPEAAVDSFKPVGPRLADNELYLFEDTLTRKEEGQLTQAQANAILAAVTVLRTAARLGQRPPSA